MKSLKTCKTFRLHRNLFTLIASLAVVGHCLNADAAGTVNFSGSMSALVINGTNNQPVDYADGVSAALYWAPLGSTNFVQLGAAVRVPPLSSVPAGAFAGGTRTTGAATPGGNNALFQVRAWAGTSFATYEDAVQQAGTLAGQSAIVESPTGNPDGDPPAAPASLAANGLQTFSLLPQTGIAPLLSVFRTTTNTIAVWWPVSETTWQLQAAASLVSTGSTWSPCSYVTNGANCVFIESPPAGDRFYRLKNP